MAELDDLVGQVQDADLRRALEAAVRRLKRQKRFGLVVERHIPEEVSCRDCASSPVTSAAAEGR